jgi:hypothetical protein
MLAEGDTGWAASPPFVAGRDIAIYVSGYPSEPGIRLALEDIQTGQQLSLKPALIPGPQWQKNRFHLPPDWAGESIRIVAQDKSTAMGGWIGFSEPVSSNLWLDLSGAVKILSLVFVFTGVLLLPAVAACLFAALRGVGDSLDLMATALAAIGLTGYAAFWAYFLNHRAGTGFTYLTVGASIATVLAILSSRDQWPKLVPIKRLVMPAALLVLVSGFVVSLGLLRGGADVPLEAATMRFRPPDLVGDHLIPKIFADGLYAGHIPRPIMDPGWLSSDRPPLQAGTTVWMYPLISGSRDREYFAVSVVLQCLFVAGLWAFLSAGRVNHTATALVLAICCFSGFIFVNGFYTWPKLYPVAYLLMASAYLLTDRYNEVRTRARPGLMTGLFLALAMLSHGGSAFAIAGLTISMIILRRFPGRRFMLALVAASAVTYVPWTLYQRFYDPPGDRLLKWHLAGIMEPRPDIGFGALLIRNYREAGIKGIIDRKWSNFKILFGDLPAYVADSELLLTATGSQQREAAVARLHRQRFLFWIPCIDLAAAGPLALLLLARRRKYSQPEFLLACRLWLCIGVTVLVWCLLMFGPDAALVHEGSYFVVISALIASSIAFWAYRPLLSILVAGIQVLWSIVLYAWAVPDAASPDAGTVTGVLYGPVNWVFATGCVLLAACIIYLLARFHLVTEELSSHQVA